MPFRSPKRIPADLNFTLTEASGFRLAPLDLGVAEAILPIPRIEVPDLQDLVIAATSLALDFPLITRDGRIRDADIQTIW